MRSLRPNNEETLTKFLRPDFPTLFLFYKPSSSLEKEFLEALKKDFGDQIGIVIIALKSGTEPLAMQYKITETPTAMLYDRRGRLTGQTSDATELRKLTKTAKSVMRIDWPLAGDARYDEAMKKNPGSLHVDWACKGNFNLRLQGKGNVMDENVSGGG